MPDLFASTPPASTTTRSELHVPLPSQLEVKFTGDALLVLGLLGWLAYDRLFKSKVVSHLSGSFAPVEEERRLNSVLAQIGLITNASRVVLCAMHNGAIDNDGYHLTKLSTINSYTAPGKLPMAVPIRDLPVGRIMLEIESLLHPDSPDGWVLTEYSDDLPDPCKDHLRRNRIHKMWNKMILVNRLPIGILSLQYDETERRRPPVREEPYTELLENLYDQISEIMRRRIIHPSPMKRLWLRLVGRCQLNPTR